MPYVVEYKEQAIRRAIRDAKALDPLITVMAICEFLEKKFNHSFSHEYISKIIRKIDRELVVKVDRAKANEEIAALSERVRMARESLIRTASGQADESGIRPAYRDKTTAWRTLLAWEKLLIDTKRQLGVFDAERDNPIRDASYREISEEQRSRMAIAFRSLGIHLPEPRLIEAVATKTPSDEGTSNEPAKTATGDPTAPKPAVYDPLAAKKAGEQRKIVSPATGIAI